MSKKSVPDYVLVDRQDFVDGRYQRFLGKKDFLEKNLPPKTYHLTDLDSLNDRFNKKWKDVVICDRCQLDIEDERIVMVGNSFVYHIACLSYSEARHVPESLERYENVINLAEERDKRGLT